MKAIVSADGQLILPDEIRRLDCIAPGQAFDIERIRLGEYVVRRRRSNNEGLVDWLMACPEKGYFVPIRSKSATLL